MSRKFRRPSQKEGVEYLLFIAFGSVFTAIKKTLFESESLWRHLLSQIREKVSEGLTLADYHKKSQRVRWLCQI
jgi:hypothetical protein